MGFIVIEICVDLAFFLVWFNCLCTVATDFENICALAWMVILATIEKYFLITSIHVDVKGRKASVCRYYIMSGRDEF